MREGEPVVELLRLRLLDGTPVMVERTTFAWPVGRLPFDHDCDAVGADPVDADLLGLPPGTPLLRERRHTTSAAGEPIEYSDDRYRPDAVSFTIDNSQRARPALLRTRGQVS